jgi:hypothetical protein
MPRRRDSIARTPDEVQTEIVLPEKFDGTLDSMAALVRGPNETSHDVRCRLIELLRGEEDMEKFVEVGERMVRRKELRTLDSVAVRAGIGRSEAFGAIARVLHRFNFDVAKVIVSSVVAAHSARVATAMAEAASAPEGEVDRRLFMQTAGLHESRNQQGNVNVNVNAQANAANDNKTAVVVPPSMQALPAFDVGIKRLASALRALPAPGE